MYSTEKDNHVLYFEILLMRVFFIPHFYCYFVIAKPKKKTVYLDFPPPSPFIEFKQKST